MNHKLSKSESEKASLVNFLKPDWRKISLTVIFSLTTFMIVLSLITVTLLNYTLVSSVGSLASMKAFSVCTNDTANLTNVKECYFNETEKFSPLYNEISGELQNYEVSESIIPAIIYPGVGRLFNPVINLFGFNYEKYTPEIASLMGRDFLPFLFFVPVAISDHSYQFALDFLTEIAIMIVYFYLISCIIVWIYDKVKKK